MNHVKRLNTRWAVPGLAMMLLLAGIGAAKAGGVVPTFEKEFDPDTIGPGSTTALVFTIDNSAFTSTVDNMAFTDVLPAGITIADPASASTDCPNAVLSAPDGGTTIDFSNGQLGAGATCTIAVHVTGTATATNTSGDLTSSVGNLGAAVSTLTVDTDLPGFSKRFSPSTISAGQTSTLTFTLDNSASMQDVIQLAFTDTFPAGIEIAPLPNASSDCGTAPFIGLNIGSSDVSFSSGNTFGGQSILDAGSTCTVSVDVTAPANGSFDNVSGQLQSTQVAAPQIKGLPSPVTGGFATATLDVPVQFLSKSFTDDPVPPGGNVTLEFTVQNPDRVNAATDISFDDDLNSVVSGLAPQGALPTDPCGAGSGLSFVGGVLTLTNGSVAAGGVCVFDVLLEVPMAAAPGTFGNTTTAIMATIDGAGVIGNTASDTLFVTHAPIVTKSFIDDPVGAGGTVTLRFVMTNVSTTSSATDVAFSDNLSAVINGLTPTGVPFADPCSGATVSTFVSFDDLFLDVSGGILAPAGMAGDSCTIDVSLSVPVGAPGGTHPNTTSAITATVGGATQSGRAATDNLLIEGAPLLTKDFTDDPVPPGGTVTLEFTVEHNATATSDATGIAFTDDLTALDPAVAGLTATSVDFNDCGAMVDITTPTLIDVSGGSLMPGETCMVSLTLAVPAGATPGRKTNTTSDLTATVDGVATTGNAATDELRIAGLMLSKEFTDDPAIPGDTVNIRFTLDNLFGTADATDIDFSDDLGAALTNLTVGMAGADTCGGTPAGAGTDTFSYTGGSVTAGASCTIDVALNVPAMAVTGEYLNVTSNLTATIGGSMLTLDPANDVLLVDDELLSISKSFTDDPAIPGGTVTLEFTLENLDSTRTASAIAFSDDLGVALTGLTVGMVASDTCMGTPAGSGTGLFSYSGGSLAGGATCTVSVGLNVPAGPLPGDTFGNTTSPITGTINGFPVSGPAASDDLLVQTLTFDKSFSGVGFPGETVDLVFTLTNLDSTAGAGNLSFADNLPAGLTAVAPLPAAPCGAGSSITGTSFLTFNGGNLAPSGDCTFTVSLLVPVTATPGTFANTTSDLSSAGLSVSAAASDIVIIELPPTFAKAFAPASIGTGLSSTLTFTIDNSASTEAATSLAFTDNLPVGVAVATPSVTANTCGGTLTATAGTTSITLSGGSVGVGSICAIDVEVTGTMVGSLVNTTEDLTSSSGNSGTASDTLVVNPQPGFAKAFAPDPILTGAASTLTITIDNSASTVAATGLDFTDTLPAGLVVATPSGAATTCTGGTLTAAAGTGAISYTGGSVAAGASCTVSANVTSAMAGLFVNLSGSLTSSLGDSGAASDSLTVNGPPAFSKAFAPNPIVAGAVSTLTFSIANLASTVAATAVDFTDNLPAGVAIAAPANAATTCTGGTLSAPDGGVTIGYTGGSVSAGASCTVSVDVTSTAPASYVNTSGDLTSSLGNSGPAGDTLIVNAGPVPTFAKAFAPATIDLGAGSTLSFSIDNSGSLVIATALDFSDPLPAGVAIATPANAATSCTGGTLAAPDGGATISYTGGSLAAGASCTVTVDVTGNASGAQNNTSGNLTSSLGNSGPASATLTVNPAVVPTFAKAFAPATIDLGAGSTLTFSIDNSGSLVIATALDFSDPLPAGVAIATPANAATSCTGGTLTAPDGGATISYTGGSLAAGASCSVTVDVIGNASGVQTNTSGDLTSSLGNSGPASATLTVNPAVVPTFAKAFAPATINLGADSTLTFTIDNSGSLVEATALDFSDPLPAGVIIDTPANAATTCAGGTLSAPAGGATIGYSGGSLAAGASCSVTVDVIGNASGAQNNTSGDLTSSLGNSGTASATLTVNPAVVPTFAKTFAPAAIAVGGTSTLTFTIDNASSLVDATAVDFSDPLPAGVAIATPANAATTCPGGTLTAPDGGATISYTGGSVSAGTICTLNVDVTGTAAGMQVNNTGDLTSSLGNSGPASAMLDVAGSDLSLTKAFSASTVLPGGTIDMDLTISNASAAFSASALAFSDDLNGAIAGLAATGLPLSACGGTLSGANGNTELTFTGGTLGTASSCVITLTLQVPAAATPGTYTSTTGVLSGDLGGVPVTGAPASDDFDIAFLSFAKSFVSAAPVGGVAVLNFTIGNPDLVNGAVDIGFSDDLEAFIPGAMALGLPQADVCGAGSTISGSSVITVTGANLGPGGSCTFSVNVQIANSVAPGNYTNVTGPLQAAVGGNATTGGGATIAQAVLGVVFATPVPGLNSWGLLVLFALMLMIGAGRARKSG